MRAKLAPDSRQCKGLARILHVESVRQHSVLRVEPSCEVSMEREYGGEKSGTVDV